LDLARAYPSYFAIDRHASAGSGSDARSDRGTFASTRQRANQRPGRSTTANFRSIAFGMALTLDGVGVGRDGNHAPIDLYACKPKCKFSGSVQPSAGLCGSQLASHRRAGSGQGFAIDPQQGGTA